MQDAFWSQMQHCLVTILRRSQADQDFSSMLGRWSSLTEASRYDELLARAKAISFDDKLQQELAEDIYNYHAFLFWPLFPDIPENVIQDITLSGRLYADYLLLTDHSIDNDREDHSRVSRIISTFKAEQLYQQSLHILFKYFPADSLFWHEFRKHQAAMMQALLLEDALQSKTTHQVYDHDLFEQVACGKSAMTKCSVAALALLAESSASLEQLYPLLNEIAIVAQIYDDFCDWQNDFEKGHFSYLLIQFLAEIGLDPQTVDISQVDRKDLKRQFFQSQALQKMLLEGQSRLEKLLPAPELTHCEGLLKALNIYFSHLRNLQEQITALQQRARKLVSAVHDGSQTHKAIYFLTASQHVGGAWSDFYTTAGESTSWVTGYVAHVLQLFAKEQIETDVLDHAAHLLLAERFPDGGWGYHRGIVADADSTAACLPFMATRLSYAETERSVQALLSFQHADGGFSTYSSPQEIAPILYLDEKADFAGWCMSQTCVTAAAIIALCQVATIHSRLDYAAAIASAIQFLLNNQQINGNWYAYWWHGDIYATALSIRALSLARRFLSHDSNETMEIARQRGIRFLLETQQDTGGWGLSINDKACPFQTGLALSALTEVLEISYRTAVDSANLYLLQAQQPNGCWKARTPIMRLPRPDDRYPWERPDPLFAGTTLGTVVSDQHHLFTTATVLRACSFSRKSARIYILEGK
ncbi:MAG TPA: prenyltransferase/squalene oxidase repeat-containing protein [Ktedonobacteraceae bacterium]